MAQLIKTPQTLTTSWTPVGDPVDTTNATRTAFWLTVTINNSLNLQIRALPLLAKNAPSDFSLPIRTVSASDVKVEAEYYELNDDIDQEIILETRTKGLIPYVQFEVRVDTLGATAAVLDTANVTKSHY